MQLTFIEFLGFLGILSSIIGGVWVLVNRFSNVEGRVGRLEDRVGSLEAKVDEILSFIRRKKMKHLYRKR